MSPPEFSINQICVSEKSFLQENESRGSGWLYAEVVTARWVIVSVAAAVGSAREPGILCLRGSTVLSLNHRGKLERTSQLPFEPALLSGASDGSILYGAGKCSPRSSLIFASINRPGKGTRALSPPPRGAGEIRLEVWTPTLSPNGRMIAAIDAPCPGGGEVSENHERRGPRSRSAKRRGTH